MLRMVPATKQRKARMVRDVKSLTVRRLKLWATNKKSKRWATAKSNATPKKTEATVNNNMATETMVHTRRYRFVSIRGDSHHQETIIPNKAKSAKKGKIMPESTMEKNPHSTTA